MAALPYIQLYPADYLADTMHLTTEEHGAYFLIILNYWQRGEPIPAKQLPAITRLNGRWTDVEDSLNEFFTVDENGCWKHERIEYDLCKVRGKSLQASRAGKASALKRATLQTTENKGKSNGRSTDVVIPLQRKGNHTDTDTDTDTDKKKNIKKKTSLPSAFEPSKANIEYAKKHGIDIYDVVEQFKANALAKDVKYVDWHAGLSTWLLRRKEWAKENTEPESKFHDATDDVVWI